MPVSPEQRKILLERLELARKAKAEKSETPKPERKKKEPAVAERTEVLPPTEPVSLPPAPAPAVAPQLKAPEPEEPPKTKKNPKNKYMKVVFYTEPGKKKVENLLKSLDDDEPCQCLPKKQKSQPQTKKSQPSKSQKRMTALTNWLAFILANYCFRPPCS